MEENKLSNLPCNGWECHCHHKEEYTRFSEDMFTHHCEHCFKSG